jgi:hypothetical protein
MAAFEKQAMRIGNIIRRSSSRFKKIKVNLFG